MPQSCESSGVFEQRGLVARRQVGPEVDQLGEITGQSVRRFVLRFLLRIGLGTLFSTWKTVGFRILTGQLS